MSEQDVTEAHAASVPEQPVGDEPTEPTLDDGTTEGGPPVAAEQTLATQLAEPATVTAQALLVRSDSLVAGAGRPETASGRCA